MNAKPLPITQRICPGCGLEFMGKGRAKWHSDQCRKQTLYARFCIDCNARLGSSDGNGPNAPLRCSPCAAVANGAERKVWTREACIAAIREWAEAHGEAPAICDWNPTQARALGAPGRESRAQAGIDAGEFPHSHTVIREFGSWHAGIEAAGFTPRDPHGGGGNEKRNRHYGKGIARNQEVARMYREGMSYDDIAAAVGWTRGGVGWTLWNLRKSGEPLPYRYRRVAA